MLRVNYRESFQESPISETPEITKRSARREQKGGPSRANEHLNTSRSRREKERKRKEEKKEKRKEERRGVCTKERAQYLNGRRALVGEHEKRHVPLAAAARSSRRRRRRRGQQEEMEEEEVVEGRVEGRARAHRRAPTDEVMERNSGDCELFGYASLQSNRQRMRNAR